MNVLLGISRKGDILFTKEDFDAIVTLMSF
jgi:hypothetical protein